MEYISYRIGGRNLAELHERTQMFLDENRNIEIVSYSAYFDGHKHCAIVITKKIDPLSKKTALNEKTQLNKISNFSGRIRRKRREDLNNQESREIYQNPLYGKSEISKRHFSRSSNPINDDGQVNAGSHGRRRDDIDSLSNHNRFYGTRRNSFKNKYPQGNDYLDDKEGQGYQNSSRSENRRRRRLSEEENEDVLKASYKRR